MADRVRGPWHRPCIGLLCSGADWRREGPVDLGKVGLFRLMTEKMAWHGQRQAVLAQNVANADTPEYQPRDLKAFTFKTDTDFPIPLPMAATASGHQAGTLAPAGAGPFRDGKSRTVYETAPDGNAVVLEEQALKVGQNAGDFQAVTNLYRKQLGMIRLAIGRPGG